MIELLVDNLKKKQCYGIFEYRVWYSIGDLAEVLLQWQPPTYFLAPAQINYWRSCNPESFPLSVPQPPKLREPNQNRRPVEERLPLVDPASNYRDRQSTSQ